MTMTRKASVTTEAIKKMKATATMTMTLMNRHKGNNRMGVAWTVLLMVIWKK